MMLGGTLAGCERESGFSTALTALPRRPANVTNCAGYARSPTLSSTALDRILRLKQVPIPVWPAKGLGAGRRGELWLMALEPSSGFGF
jgi:hypothetical protein